MSHEQPDEPTQPLPAQPSGSGGPGQQGPAGPAPAGGTGPQDQAHPGPRYQQPYPPPSFGQGRGQAASWSGPGAQPSTQPSTQPPPQAQPWGGPGPGQVPGGPPAPWAGPQSTQPPQPTAALPVHPAAGASPAAEARRRPRALWPTVVVLALLVGAVAGAVAGASVARGGETVIGVQRRTALPLPADNTSIAAVASKVLPGTVQIVAEYQGKADGATGSGFVYDGKGHVITNNHVVARADEDKGPIEVIDQEGDRFPAKVVGRSTVYDLAVLEVTGATKLPALALGSAQQMRVGETVVAIGSPLGLSATVTSGIVSALNRPVTTGEGANENSYINALQTDAAINPGNSGGPLVNLQGQVVGVNSAIASLGSSLASDQGGNIGVGFAIPVEQVQVTATQIIRTGKAQYPVIGANVSPAAGSDGARVDNVAGGTPAARSDLRAGDVITRIDGKPVTNSIDLVVAIRTHVPGEKVRLRVQRNGQTKDIEVGLAAKTG